MSLPTCLNIDSEPTPKSPKESELHQLCLQISSAGSNRDEIQLIKCLKMLRDDHFLSIINKDPSLFNIYNIFPIFLDFLQEAIECCREISISNTLDILCYYTQASETLSFQVFSSRIPSILLEKIPDFRERQGIYSLELLTNIINNNSSHQQIKPFLLEVSVFASSFYDSAPTRKLVESDLKLIESILKKCSRIPLKEYIINDPDFCSKITELFAPILNIELEFDTLSLVAPTVYYMSLLTDDFDYLNASIRILSCNFGKATIYGLQVLSKQIIDWGNEDDKKCLESINFQRLFKYIARECSDAKTITIFIYFIRTICMKFPDFCDFWIDIGILNVFCQLFDRTDREIQKDIVMIFMEVCECSTTLPTYDFGDPMVWKILEFLFTVESPDFNVHFKVGLRALDWLLDNSDEACEYFRKIGLDSDLVYLGEESGMEIDEILEKMIFKEN